MSRARECIDDVLVSDALAIWQAGVDAVRADRVVIDRVHWDGRWLTVDETPYDLQGMDRLVIVGAGKATYGMLCGLRAVFEQSGRPTPKWSGWINVPEGEQAFHHERHRDEQQPYRDDLEIEVCEARPRGVNEPTDRVVAGTQQILRLVENADARTCVVTLLSGGGSALLCAPAPGISLATKIALTRRLSAAGASIQQLNEVRRCLSQVKGGGLASRCRAATMISLILSDVMGDPLEFIASGPTVLDPVPNPSRAIAILESLCPEAFPGVIEHLQKPSNSQHSTRCDVHHHIVGNNATAVDAAGTQAVALGYRYWMRSATEGDGPAESFAQRLAGQLITSRENGLIDCLILGGEPTVVLPDAELCGQGGRNQQVVLAAGDFLLRHDEIHWPFALVSGGTDGEDGNTQAAGAWIDRRWFARCREEAVDVGDFLHRCDAYSLFSLTGNLLITGPTHTNVCDLRVGLLPRTKDQGRK